MEMLKKVSEARKKTLITTIILDKLIESYRIHSKILLP